MCYGVSRNDAAAKVEALALRAIADRLDEGEMAASPTLSRRWNVLRHEPMAFFEGAAGLGRTSPDWLARQTTDRVASNAHQTELAGCGVCVSRRGRNRPEDACAACQADRPFPGGLEMISIVLSRNSPHPADGESSKISPSAQACPAATRQKMHKV